MAIRVGTASDRAEPAAGESELNTSDRRARWAEVHKACNDAGALLIFDEIPTGLGKALGGGILPLAAVVTTPELDVGERFAFGHYTHEKNPVSAMAGLTTLQIIEDESLVENAVTLGENVLYRCLDRGLSFKLSLGNVLTFTLLIKQGRVHRREDGEQGENR